MVRSLIHHALASVSSPKRVLTYCAAAAVVVTPVGLMSSGGIASASSHAQAQAVARPAAADASAGKHFVATWGSSMQGIDAHFLTDTTIRMIARVTVGGDRVEVRLSNSYGAQPLRIGGAYVGIASGQPFVGSAVKAGTNVRLTFASRRTATIAPGAELWSDPAPLSVPANTDIAVSIYLPQSNVAVTEHTSAVTTSFYTNELAGDRTANLSGSAFTQTTTSMFLLDAVAVRAPSSVCAIVAFGDSITDGTATTIDGHNRWEDFLARRIDDRGANSRGVVNEGIGGNTVTASVGADIGPKVIDRQPRDVLSLPGVCSVVAFMGTNDIAHGATPASRIIAGLRLIISRDHKAGLQTVGVTIIPRDLATGWDPASMDPIRARVNAFIRSGGAFDATIDFDALLRDPQEPNVLNPLYGSDDHIHPNPYGYFVMGTSVPLSLFR